MAETVADQDLSGGSQKRKRGAEHGSPDSRRSKRGAPAASMANPDNLTSSFMDSGDAAASASVNLADFNALQAAAASDHPESADPANVSSTAAAALNYPTLSIPQSTEETFAPQGVDGDHGADASFNTADMSHNEGIMEAHPTTTTVPASVAAPAPVSAVHGVSAAVPVAQQPQNGVRQDFRPPNARPAVGSEEWHKIRKDNHKEVERRRRETINEGINELSKIVPGCEKNKGSILQRAVAFITQLKENEAQNIEKWTLEKLLTEQAIAELSASNDKLKQECDRLYRELETWKRVAQAAGVEAPKEEPSAAPVSSSSS